MLLVITATEQLQNNIFLSFRESPVSGKELETQILVGSATNMVFTKMSTAWRSAVSFSFLP